MCKTARACAEETWPSGLRRTPGKRVGVNAPQGFESLRLRHALFPLSPPPFFIHFDADSLFLRSGQNHVKIGSKNRSFSARIGILLTFDSHAGPFWARFRHYFRPKMTGDQATGLNGSSGGSSGSSGSSLSSLFFFSASLLSSSSAFLRAALASCLTFSLALSLASSLAIS